MKEVIPSAHQSEALPILDTEMWLSNGRLMHSHYSKPMASIDVILQRLEKSMTSKDNILFYERAEKIDETSA